MKAQSLKVWNISKTHVLIITAVFRKNNSNINCKNWKDICGKWDESVI